MGMINCRHVLLNKHIFIMRAYCMNMYYQKHYSINIKLSFFSGL